MTGLNMTDERGVGERKERAKRASVAVYYALLMLVGGAVGFVFAMYETESAAWADGNIPPAVAIVLAVVTAVAMLSGCIIMKRRVDEVELQHNLYAGTWAAIVLMVGYPVWYLLWKGQLVPEPMHTVMFVTLNVVMAIVYLVRKFR